MSQRPPVLRLRRDEIVIDSFAGGGGASEGIDAALASIGRHVDIAINHDAEAIALHRINHPKAEHYTTDVFSVNIVEACRGRPVGLAWYSPDCTFHSKARGGKPFRHRNTARRLRGLAWVIVKHAKELRDAGTPIRIIAMENVQEFADWGPLDEEGKIIAIKKGTTFRKWCRQLANLGYEMDMWVIKGCDYGAPTTRERLFIVCRLDGHAIAEPRKSHGKGRSKPWRTAAECIDWAIPCPSIFERKRPLADNTLRRIAEGIKRYVDCADPFIIPVAHQGDARVNSIHEPLRTVTAERRGDFAIVQPFIAGVGGRMGQSVAREVTRPMQTVTGKADAAVVTPFLARIGQTGGNGAYVNDPEQPLTTITTKGEHLVVEPFLVRYHGERREGENPRVESVTDPLPTQTAENRFALCAPIIVGAGGPEYSAKPVPADRPLGTQTGENHRALLAAYMVPRYREREGQSPRCQSIEKPMATVVPTQNGAQLVAAFLAKQNGVDEKMVVGQHLEGPMHTITAVDQKALVSSHLVKLRGTSTAQGMEEPLHTISAGGMHFAEVRAFLIKFYSSGGQWGSVKEPLGTVTAKDRLGLVTIRGEQYQIVDIGLRMLTPRELFRAQGFREDYEIEYGLMEEPADAKAKAKARTKGLKSHKRKVKAKLRRVKLTKTAQVRMCGNSVCPPVAEAIVRAQLGLEVQT